GIRTAQIFEHLPPHADPGNDEARVDLARERDGARAMDGPELPERLPLRDGQGAVPVRELLEVGRQEALTWDDRMAASTAGSRTPRPAMCRSTMRSRWLARSSIGLLAATMPWLGAGNDAILGATGPAGFADSRMPVTRPSSRVASSLRAGGT